MSMPMLKRHWTAQDLHDLPDDGNRYEIIDGRLFVTPSPSLVHQLAIGELFKLLTAYVATQPGLGLVVLSPADVTFSDTRVVQPDLFVAPLDNGRIPRDLARIKHLLLAVEVVSPSSARADRVDKRWLYREEHVEEYWVVDLDARAIERSTPDQPRADIFAERIIWKPVAAKASLEIDLASYFARILDD